MIQLHVVPVIKKIEIRRLMLNIDTTNTCCTVHTIHNKFRILILFHRFDGMVEEGQPVRKRISVYYKFIR